MSLNQLLNPTPWISPVVNNETVKGTLSLQSPAGLARILYGATGPNAVSGNPGVTGNIGDLYINVGTSGATGTTLYVKEYNSNANTNWTLVL